MSIFPSSIQSQGRSAAGTSSPPYLPTGGPLIGLLGAGFDTGNHGVSALASGAVSAMHAGFPRARFALVDYGVAASPRAEPVGGHSVPMEQILLRFSKKPWQPNHIARLLLLAGLIRLVPNRSWRRRLARRDPWLRKISEAGVLFSLAGGDSFSDIYGLRRLAYMAMPQLLVLLLERPLVLLPQTYGPYRSRMSRVLVRPILRHARGILSRDRAGLAIVRGLQAGRGAEPRLAYDLGFALEPRPPGAPVLARLEEIRRRGPLAGFNVSGLLWIGGYGGGNRFGLKSDYAWLIRELLELLIEVHGAQVLLIPHVYGPETAGSESDAVACRAVVREWGHRHPQSLHFFDQRFDHRETKYLIGQCDFLQASRMHACIAALSQSVPALGLAYSRKFSGVMDLVGEGAPVVDLRFSDAPAVVGAVDRAWRNRDALRRQLLETMPAIRASVLDCFRQPEFQEMFREEAA